MHHGARGAALGKPSPRSQIEIADRTRLCDECAAIVDVRAALGARIGAAYGDPPCAHCGRAHVVAAVYARLEPTAPASAPSSSSGESEPRVVVDADVDVDEIPVENPAA